MSKENIQKVDPPVIHAKQRPKEANKIRKAAKIDFAKRDERNRKLGENGESFALQYEKRFLERQYIG